MEEFELGVVVALHRTKASRDDPSKIEQMFDDIEFFQMDELILSIQRTQRLEDTVLFVSLDILFCQKLQDLRFFFTTFEVCEDLCLAKIFGFDELF